MKKLFGYPEFDKNGEKILTTYNNEYSDMMMDIRVYRLEAGETREFMRKEKYSHLFILSHKFPCLARLQPIDTDVHHHITVFIVICC